MNDQKRLQELRTKCQRLLLLKKSLLLKVREVRRLSSLRIRDLKLINSPLRMRLIEIERSMRDADLLDYRKQITDVEQQLLEVRREILTHQDVDR